MSPATHNVDSMLPVGFRVAWQIPGERSLEDVHVMEELASSVQIGATKNGHKQNLFKSAARGFGG